VKSSLRIQPLAEGDLHEAYAWYEQRAPGLGDDFMDAADECFRKHNEFGSLLGGVGGKVGKFLEGFGRVEQNRTCLNDCCTHKV
jgi:hypothetical protein